MKNASLYANETLTSFFRRLTFTPDGSLLLTPSGQYQNQHQTDKDAKPTYEIINTVYIYTRGGINKPPIAHLPGHKKPSVVVKCSPIFYTLRQSPPVTKHVTIDTSSAEDTIPSLPEPVSKASTTPSVMDPPPLPTPASTTTAEGSAPSKGVPTETNASTPGPKPAFALPYRMVYAVATQDSVLLYDTQQKTPICIVSNLHCATFTDLAWYVYAAVRLKRSLRTDSFYFYRSTDGLTLIISSSDGFCSSLTFAPGELGEIYKGEVGAKASASAPTPTSTFASPASFPSGPQHQSRNSSSSFTAPSPPATSAVPSNRPSSPTRSNSTSSVATQSGVVSNPPLISGNVPSITAANSGRVTGVPLTTPPETPKVVPGPSTGVKRDAEEAEKEDTKEPKKRRIAPTLVSN